MAGVGLDIAIASLSLSEADTLCVAPQISQFSVGRCMEVMLDLLVYTKYCSAEGLGRGMESKKHSAAVSKRVTDS